ncbi:MAG TPA: hypothetical protein VJV39_13860 [Dongiaceae bacterium]|nr:hypothetical protein [Dongiaceae bacterium]
MSALDEGINFVDADGIAGFELAVDTLKTADAITVGQDVIVGF